MNKNIVEAVVSLGQLVLQFGRIDRITFQEDGITPESDTDHTVMLGLVCTAYAAQVRPDLDLGKIAQFALVHDLVEVHAGDTPSIADNLSHDQRDEKQKREEASFAKIKSDFGISLPWIPDMIEEYESLRTPEARFVKTMDKVMPKILNILNKTQALKRQGQEYESFYTNLKAQREKMEKSYAADQPEALALFDDLVVLMMDIMKNT